MHSDYFTDVLNLESHMNEDLFDRPDLAEFLLNISSQLLNRLGLLENIESLPERMTLWDDERFEFVLCHWPSNTIREWHHHPGVQCWFRCVEGQVLEHRNNQDFIRVAGETAYIDDSLGPHQIENDTNTSAITVHIYKKIKE